MAVSTVLACFILEVRPGLLGWVVRAPPWPRLAVCLAVDLKNLYSLSRCLYPQPCCRLLQGLNMTVIRRLLCVDPETLPAPNPSMCHWLCSV